MMLNGNPRLTNAELAVLKAAANGERHYETALKLHYSIGHVSNVRGQAMAKLGAKNITHAVAKALRRGLIR